MNREYIKTFQDLEKMISEIAKNNAYNLFLEALMEPDYNIKKLEKAFEELSFAEQVDYNSMKEYCDNWYLGEVEKSDINYLIGLYLKSFEKEIKKRLKEEKRDYIKYKRRKNKRS